MDYKHDDDSFRQRWFVKSVQPWRFASRQEEFLYLDYTRQQKERAIPRFLAIGWALMLFTILVPGERNWSLVLTSLVFIISGHITLMALYACVKTTRIALSHGAWMLLWLQLMVGASRRVGDSYNELLGWALIVQYFTSAALPFDLFTVTIYSMLGCTAYLSSQFYNVYQLEGRPPDDVTFQQSANAAMLLAVTMLGITAFYINDYQQRCSFQETKRSLRDKLTIEQQSKEQERLLLSVLPEHVAVEMRRDLGLIDTQFKKIYMSRHENVSILYADIVGFTAISSTYSAQDLVAILNELFARFDRLAEKYQQLRIKILGDCYYCISGAPIERPDHAALCVHMGLSMVKAIKYVQQTTNSPVDMRVGIHTGAVLAGVLGQRQWQFDVYSRDVELANKMESSGLAGRVHISEVTLGYLNDDFEVEPAYGEKREEMLRQAGIKTYFIVRVLKPYQGDEKGGENSGEGDSELRDDDEDSVLSPERENEDENEETIIHRMLVEELENRDDEKELADATTLCMTFRSQEAEASYVARCDPSPASVLGPPLLMLPPLLVLACFAQPVSWSAHLSYAGFVVESGISCIIYYATYRISQLKKKHVNPDKRHVFSMINLGALSTATFLPLFMCGEYEKKLHDGLRPDAISHSGARRCLHPSYYYHLIVYTLCVVLWLAPSTCLRRAGILLVVLFFHGAAILWNPIILEPRPLFDNDPYMGRDNTTFPYNEIFVRIAEEIHPLRNILMLCFICIVLMIFDRYLESLDRARHSRAERMRRQAEQAADLRRRNQALVYNVLPPHVARHFMGAHRHHRDLYSQSYAEVGVLFASMPNFTEFYSEETVNNQGLECLRFLNEVISDFDLLLEDPKYNRDIIKIKTISSTYMAASGLNPTRQMQPSDGVTVRWAHLANLVEFALELQRVLAAINEQSFNHFVLRVGLNHGPITAGVIGARKPHYDIWGNTVNVASRMESTGKAGCIQVTEENCHILEAFGYYFEQRGLVAVKGKGQLMTYYLQGKRNLGDAEKPAGVPAETATAPEEANGEVTGLNPVPDSEADQPLLA